MNPNTRPHLRGFLDDFIGLREHTLPLPPALPFPAETVAWAENDFLVQNHRPDLVSYPTFDQALRALDLP